MVEKISLFTIRSIKSELEFKNQVPKIKVSYSYRNKKNQPKKLNPKLKLPPINKDFNESTFNQELDLDNELREVKEDINNLKKLFDARPNFELESKYVTQHSKGTTESTNIDGTKSEPNFELESKCVTQPSKCTTESANIDGTKSELNEVSSVVDNILSLEDKLKQSFIELEQIRQDRLKEQNEICSEIQLLNKCPFENRNSQLFLKICKYKETKSISKVRFVAKPMKTIKPDGHKSQDNSKNTQLSKNINMSTLTDEEKARIHELLADMDENGEDIEPRASEDDESEIKDFSNAFIFRNAEKTKIDEIQEKLEEFEDSKDKREFLSKFDEKNFDQIDWKKIKELSMKEIDNALETLRTTERSENVEKTEKLEETENKTT